MLLISVTSFTLRYYYFVHILAHLGISVKVHVQEQGGDKTSFEISVMAVKDGSCPPSLTRRTLGHAGVFREKGCYNMTHMASNNW